MNWCPSNSYSLLYYFTSHISPLPPSWGSTTHVLPLVRNLLIRWISTNPFCAYLATCLPNHFIKLHNKEINYFHLFWFSSLFIKLPHRYTWLITILSIFQFSLFKATSKMGKGATKSIGPTIVSFVLEYSLFFFFCSWCYSCVRFFIISNSTSFIASPYIIRSK